METVRLLLERGANANAQTQYHCPLTWAVGDGSIETVRLLIEWGADVNPEIVDYKPLMQAARRGNNARVRFLIERGADVNAQSKDGMTALKYAILKGHHDTAELLQLLQRFGAKEALDRGGT